jgi:SP family general alpha glucoside:H+ symporter-like MFS transporter
VRATVLNELRQGQPQTQGPLNASGRSDSPDTSVTQDAPNSVMDRSPNVSGSGVLETGAVDACINAYLERIYPVIPFLTAEILRSESILSSSIPVSRQFIASFCAYVVTFGKVLDEAYTSATDLGPQLLKSALRVQIPERVSTPTHHSVFISFFLYGAYAGIGNYRQGWFYLREATTLFMMQRGVNSVQGWYSHDVHRCLFWVLVISERFAYTNLYYI